MKKKAQVELLANPHVLGGAVVVALMFLGYFLFFNRENTPYPLVPSKYDYETFHMVTAEAIMARGSNGYIDDRRYSDWRSHQYVLALLKFYSNRKEMKYLDEAIRLLDIVKSRATDSNGDGLLDFKEYYTAPDAGVLSHGHKTQLYVEAIHVIRKNNVAKYANKATEYEDFVDNHLIPYGLKFWKPYDVNGEKRGYYLASLDSKTSDGYNRAAGMTAAILRRGLDTHNKEFIEIGERYVNRFFSVNQVKTFTGIIYKYDKKTDTQLPVQVTNMPYIQAKYYLYDKDSGEILKTDITASLTDFSHLNSEFNFLRLAFENGLIPKEKSQLITNAFYVMKYIGKVDTRTTPVFNNVMSPPRRLYANEADKYNIFLETAQIYNIITFAANSPDLVYDFEEILRNIEIDGRLQGNYYSSFYRCVQVKKDICPDCKMEWNEFCTNLGRSGYEASDASMLLAIANLGDYQ